MSNIISQTINEYCYEIRELREALNNAIAAGDILRGRLPHDEYISEQEKIAIILLENSRKISLKG